MRIFCYRRSSINEVQVLLSGFKLVFGLNFLLPIVLVRYLLRLDDTVEIRLTSSRSLYMFYTEIPRRDSDNIIAELHAAEEK